MNRWLIAMVVAMMSSVLLQAAEVEVAKTPPRIQVAVLLDTSGSMDGLIEQAKTQLWALVTDLAKARQRGVTPVIEVALYEYGKQSLPSSEGYLRMILPLTTDLDRVSQELFALRTNGGDEYCGWVIQSATQVLAWSPSDSDLKTIYIAGNEPFSQGKVDFREACRQAIAKGITVNTIFCGNEAEGRSTGWLDGAKLADGSFMNIDQNRRVVHIDAPQDAELVKLSAELNTTYVAVGQEGKEAMARQSAQDANAAATAPAVSAIRAAAKASSAYRNESWDLVDAVKAGRKLEEVKEAELPEVMRNMKPEEREAYVKQQADKRAELQQRMRTLQADRDTFVAAERAKQAATAGAKSLDEAMIQSLRQQAEKKGFTYE